MTDHSTPVVTAQPGSLPLPPRSGFVGRSREVEELRALLTIGRPSPVWVAGYDGIGKTALVGHVARHLVDAGRYQRVVYTNLGRSGLGEMALYDLGQSLFGPEFRVSAQAVDQIAEELARTATLVIWDQVQEALYGGRMAMDQPALVTWYQMANRLATSGSSALCIISDGIEFPASSRRLAGVHQYTVSAMGDEEAMVLCAALDRSGSREDMDPTWVTLIEWLGGHPLALACLAAARHRQPLEQLANDLIKGLPGLREGEGRHRNRAVDIAIERMIGTLGAPLSEHMTDLGIFVGGFVQNLGPEIMGFSREAWVEQHLPLVEAGLVWDEAVSILTVPVVRMHASLQRWASQRLGPQRRAEMAELHHRHYSGLMAWIVQSGARLREGGPRLFSQDIGNMREGLDRAVAGQDMIAALTYMGYYGTLLKELGFEQEVARASEFVNKAAESVLPQEGPWTSMGVALVLRQARALLSAGDVPKAGTLLSQLAGRMERPGGIDYGGPQAALDRAQVLLDLSRVLRATQHVDVAIRSLREAIDLLSPLDPDAELRTMRAELYLELAETHISQGQIDESEQACRRGLGALGDLEQARLQGTFHAHLAMIALRRNQPDAARQEYAQALAVMAASGDLSGMATVEQQLASLAMRPPANPGAAEEHLNKALAHAQTAGHWLLQAQLHSAIAQLALQTGRPDQAEEGLRQAVALYESNRASGPLVMSLAGLAEFLLRSGRLDEAATEAERALAVGEGVGQVIPWELYLLLQRIATARKDQAAVPRWRVLTRDAYAGSPQAAATRDQWKPILDAFAKAARGEAMDTDAAQTLEEMERTPQWRELAQRILRILSGDRDMALIEDLDHIDAVIVRGLLEAIESPLPT